MSAMNSSFYFITLFAIIVLFMYVQSFPLDTVMNETTNPEDTVILIPRHTKRSIYGLYRYIPKMDENKIKKDYDDFFESGYARYYFTE